MNNNKKTSQFNESKYDKLFNCFDEGNDEEENERIEKEERFREYIKSLKISLANLEKLGASLLVIGYANFLYSAYIDIIEINECEYNGRTAIATTLYGQQLALMGYIVLYIISVKRLDIKNNSKNTQDEELPIRPFQLISSSYLLSIVANGLRVKALAEIEYFDRTGEIIV